MILNIALVHAVLMSLFVWDMTKRQHSMLLEGQTEKALAIARSVATSSAGWVVSQDWHGLQEIIIAQSRYPELLFAMVTSIEGKVLAHSDTSRLDLYIKNLPSQPETTVITQNSDLVDAISPVLLSDNLVGWVRVGLDQKATEARLAIITRDGFIYGFIAILLGSTLAWLMGTRLMRRLKEIERIAGLIEGGATENRAIVEGHDELAHVAHAFNTMLDGMLSSNQQLKDANQRILIATDSAEIGIWEFDNKNNTMHWDDWTYRIYGITEKNSTEPFQTWKALVHPDDIDPACLGNQGDFGEYNAEFRIILAGGKVRWIKSHATNIYDDKGDLLKLIGVNQDITDKKEQNALIKRQANYDDLTGLPNRKLFLELLAQEFEQVKREAQKCWLLFIDLDEFKEVNDTLGHDVGDDLLIKVSSRLQHNLRNVDIIARLGGDEFVVILSQSSDLSYVDSIASKLIDAVTKPFVLKGSEVYISASIGIACYPSDADNARDLLKFADQSMYASKNAGKNRYSYFTPSLQNRALIRAQVSGELRHAVKNDELELFYQPIINLQSGEMYKAEALIRWNHPDKGLVSPAEFIPIAEQTGLICDMGCWIFDSAFNQLNQWGSRLPDGFQLSINMSPFQLKINPNNYDNWLERMEQHNVSGEKVVIEITEGLLLKSEKVVAERLLQYREAGVQVAIDDFGTGYSSLSYLKEFDIDYLKIDRSFISNLKNGSDEHSLSEAIVVMAHKLGLKVIAEGVETECQKLLLKQMNCDYCQGYLYSKPIPAAEFEALYLYKGKAKV